MSKIIPEIELPLEISSRSIISLAYPTELADAQNAIERGLSILIECDKSMAMQIYASLRNILRESYSFINVDGRAAPDPANPMMPSGIVATMINQISDIVRGGTSSQDGLPQVVVLPHLDILTTSGGGGVTSEAKEAIALMHENPTIRWIGFRDPSFSLPKTITQKFNQTITFMGVGRDRLQYLVTRREAQKLSSTPGLDIYRLYKQVSGLNAIRLRELMGSIVNMEDYPTNPDPVWKLIRMATIEGNVKMPDTKFGDIGGYPKVKDKLQKEILDLLRKSDDSEDEKQIEFIENLIPRGMLFEGPPGTGKTLFAKAMANELGAAVIIVNGPELKSKWVGESEENLRNIFVQARKMAPCIIVFDELDSFAGRRDRMGAGSGVEHSMVNQLLTEMDGFKKNELVFIVGTTNFVESIDPALLRPGRFEFYLTIPYPDEVDRKEIIEIYNKKFHLHLEEQAIADAVKIAGYPLGNGGFWSGDHIQALCRQIARNMLREGFDVTTSKHVEDARKAGSNSPELNQEERKIVATHECGHAVVLMRMKELPQISRISIQGNISGALGFVEYGKAKNENIITHEQLFERIQVLFGGMLAEEIILGTKSVGSSHDLQMANNIARALITQFGYKSSSSVVAQSVKEISEETKSKTDLQVQEVLINAETLARKIIEDAQEELLGLRSELLEKEFIDIQPRSFEEIKTSKKKNKKVKS